MTIGRLGRAVAVCAVLGLGATSCSDPGSEPSVSSANRTSTPVYASATDTRTGASGPASSSPEPRVTGPTADTAGPAYPMTEADLIVDGIDWRMPDWVRPAQNSGFFSESASPADKVYVRGLDQSWRQLQPTPGKPIYTDTGQAHNTDTGTAQGMSVEPLDQALA